MTPPPGATRYVEAGRTYVTTLVLFLVLLAGFVVDLVIGGGVSHLLAWVIAIVIVVGTEALTVYAARTMRSITVTDTAIRVGEESLLLADITTAGPVGDSEDRILGRRYATALPRGSEGIAVQLRDGTGVIVATRKPAELLTALVGPDAAPARLEIREAATEDLSGLEEIAERADSLFRVAGHELPVIVESDERLPAEVIFVVGRPPVGFAEVAQVDGTAYLAELAVIPGQMRHGYGTGLVEQACSWAAARGYPALTLTTYADIAWNAPFYRRLGFVEVTDPTPGLLAVRARETRVGLDAVGPRIVMRRALA
ncbi:GNAT family N-acetyltransferase [Jatrophihabitans sp.]|uniref:GNAT family N-acetyltransferase n=1 Tax=Jatrophihabitans sp. TaxID=1932789 RepID=UPI0030C7326B|nr:family N-acetyltransferase [Jatrophihabitans sp.]